MSIEKRREKRAIKIADFQKLRETASAGGLLLLTQSREGDKGGNKLDVLTVDPF